MCGIHTQTAAGKRVAYSEFTTFALGAGGVPGHPCVIAAPLPALSCCTCAAWALERSAGLRSAASQRCGWTKCGSAPAGGFRVDDTAASSSKGRPAAATAINATPDRSPDAVFKVQTSGSQAALYRLSGDINPVRSSTFTVLAAWLFIACTRRTMFHALHKQAKTAACRRRLVITAGLPHHALLCSCTLIQRRRLRSASRGRSCTGCAPSAWPPAGCRPSTAMMAGSSFLLSRWGQPAAPSHPPLLWLPQTAAAVTVA